MSRRRGAVIRQVHPDAKYGNVIITKFINSLMSHGKKSIAEKALYSALEEAAQKLNVDPVEMFEKILENVRPAVEVRSKRVGGATYQVPCDVRPVRQLALAIRWIIIAARNRKDRKTISTRLAAEFMDAFNLRGASVKKREDTHKMADSNRAFAHFNW